jgi:hypothetical protein
MVRGNIFEIIDLAAFGTDAFVVTGTVRFGELASMILLFSFCAEGQGYTSQRQLWKSLGPRLAWHLPFESGEMILAHFPHAFCASFSSASPHSSTRRH